MSGPGSGTPSDVPAGDRWAIEALRQDLADAGYTVDAIGRGLSATARAALDRDQVEPARLETAGRTDPQAVLLRLFGLGECPERRALDAALPRSGSDGAERLGLVRASGADPHDPVRAAVDLDPYAAVDDRGPIAWTLASDRTPTGAPAPLRPDYVLGVGGASLTLAELTVRTPAARTLDMGTGCGIQALHASRHSGCVVATDVSDRALAYARFNAALAGVDLDLRAGSLLAPVAGQTFDLVVSNPPFVITPRDAGLPDYAYRDGGQEGDTLLRTLLADLPGVLAPGGVAQLLGNWELHDGGDWRERVGAWLPEGLDAWVVQRETTDAAEYAETWLRDGGMTPAHPDYADAYRAYLRDFARRGVQGVGFGWVVLRRPGRSGTAPWRRLEEARGPAVGPLGAHVADVLRAVDALRGADVRDLAARRLAVAPDVTEERYLRPGEADPQVILLRQGGGLGRAVQASTELAALVGACDGDLPLGPLTSAVAQLLGQDPARTAVRLHPQVIDLLETGMLALAD